MQELNSGPPKTNPSSGREEDLNPGPPAYKCSALTTRPHSPPIKKCPIKKHREVTRKTQGMLRCFSLFLFALLEKFRAIIENCILQQLQRILQTNFIYDLCPFSITKWNRYIIHVYHPITLCPSSSTALYFTIQNLH